MHLHILLYDLMSHFFTCLIMPEDIDKCFELRIFQGWAVRRGFQLPLDDAGAGLEDGNSGSGGEWSQLQ